MKKRIIVIGDWLIDEHWITGIHRSSTSSRVGQSHFRGLQTPDCAIQSFCGAGQTASALLRSLDNNGKNQFKIMGIGVWHKNDTNYLCSMLDQEEKNFLTPHQFTYNKKPRINNRNANLFNLSDIIRFPSGFQMGTTNVIRVYQNIGGKIELLQRIDWEQELPEGFKGGWINDKNKNKVDINKLEHALISFSKKPDAIVVKDLCKGVISREIIKFLNTLYPKAPWFISSKGWEVIDPEESSKNNKKNWKPDWIEELPKSNVRLFLIPQVPAKNALKNGIVGSWLTKFSKPTLEAMKVIEDFLSIFKDFSKNSLVILPDGFSIIGVDNPAAKHDCFVQYMNRRNLTSVGLPMASLFFAAVTQRMVLDETESLQVTLRSATVFTKGWMEYESKRIKTPEKWKPTSVPQIRDFQIKNDPKYHLNWVKEKRAWESAHKLNGIIKEIEDGVQNSFFELLRGMTDIDGYICLSPSKKRAINLLSRKLRSYKNQKEQSSKAYLINAAPGSGKSYLIQCLARELGFRLLSFNVSQMLSKKDILDCFDTIITTQFNQKVESPILVFFDEINTKIRNEYVYDMFLAPLEDGIFVRGGKKYPIKPFVWVFIGTDSSKNMRTSDVKADDFLSRLDNPPLSFGTNASYISKTEMVYIGVSLLRSYYPDVQQVSEKVLGVFYQFPVSQIRDIKHFVKDFKNIQYGKVLSNNVPTGWIKIFLGQEFDLDKFQEQPEGDLIEIR